MLKTVVKTIIVSFALASVLLTLSVLYLNLTQVVTPLVEVTTPVMGAPATSVNVPTKTKLIKRLTLNPLRTLYLDNVVSSVSVEPIITRLKELDTTNEPVYLLINSPGGSVFDGYQLVSQMEGMQAPVYTVCTKMCASMAAIIHQYGKKRYMIDRAYLMFHPATGGIEGQVPNMISRLSTIQNTMNRTNRYIASRSSVPLDEFEKKLAYENWVEGEDAVANHMADGLVIIANLPNEAAGPADLFGQAREVIEIRNFQWNF